jgi:hydrogenase maturation protease
VAEAALRRPPGPRSGQPRPVVVIGVGNALRGDDAAGLEAVRLLRARAEGAPIAVREQEGETLGLLERWAGAGAAVLLDAVRSGAEPGTIHRVDVSSQPIPARLRSSSSTHMVGLGEAIELARALGRLPGRTILYGLEGLCFDAGSGLSAELRAALPAFADAAFREACGLRRAG